MVKGGALSDTLRKLTSAHLAGGPTPHEGWALAGGGQRGEGGGEQTHRPRGKNPSRAVGGGGSNETETKSIIKCIKIICVDHYHVYSELPSAATHRCEGSNPSHWWVSSPPPSPLCPPPRGPTPREGWALVQGGQRSISLEYQIKLPPLTHLIL